MKKRTSVFLILFFSFSAALLTAFNTKEATAPQTIYVAWSNNQNARSFTATLRSIEAIGANAVVLDQALSADLTYDVNNMLVDAKDEHGILTSEAAKLVKINTWQNSNVEEMMKDVDCIIFAGGSDICPTLYYDEQEWHGIREDTNYSAERDVSDYILLSYCLEHDIPVLAICRGMQMLSVVSGAGLIQDIPAWYDRQGIKHPTLHRDPGKKDFVPHSIRITNPDSLLFRTTGTQTIDGVPSWHHQAVANVKHTRLLVTAVSETDGQQIIEAVERPDKAFCIGIQYHPEAAVKKYLDHEPNAGDFMDYDTAISLFRALLNAGAKGQYTKNAA